MTLLANADTAGGPSLLLLVLAVLAAAVVYGLVCVIKPFTGCRRCGGAGRRSRLVRSGTRRCRYCRGTGVRLRLGRRLWVSGLRASEKARV